MPDFIDLISEYDKGQILEAIAFLSFSEQEHLLEILKLIRIREKK